MRASRQLAIGDALFGQIVAREEFKLYALALQFAVLPQLRHSQLEKAANPFGVKTILDCGSGERQLPLGSIEIERHQSHPAATLQSTRRLLLISHEAIEASAQVSAKGGSGRIERGEERLVERAGKEALREILGVFIGRLPTQPHMLVSRLPI